MKKFNFYALAIAGTLFAACSADKDVAVNDGPKPGEVAADGYMSLSINLPTTSSSLRAANDEFDDGTADEYAVNNCALLLFEDNDGTEANATFLSAQSCTTVWQKDDADADNITTSSLVTAKVSGHTLGKKLYALVMLNHDKFLDTETNTLSNTDDGHTGSLAGKTFGEIRDAIATFNLTNLIGGEAKNRFFMTNAVMSNVKGGSLNVILIPAASDVFQLAPLDPNKIYNTVEKAQQNPAGEIFVERAVAKATLSLNLENPNEKKAAGKAFSKVEWVLDNIEPTTYLLRNPGDLSYIGYTSSVLTPSYYRFVSNATTWENADLGSDKHYYRTYWCVDPQYDDDFNYVGANLKQPSMYSYTRANLSFVEALDNNQTATPLYCTENTFSVKNQDYANTTRAVIKVTLSDNTPFYTINGSTTPAELTDVKKEFFGNVIKNTDVREALQNQIAEGTLNLSVTNFETFFDAGFSSNEVAGDYKLETLSLKATNDNLTIGDVTFKADAATNLASVLATAVTSAQKEIKVLQYVGEMYYEARFKHFAGNDANGTWGTDDLAPWNHGEYGEEESISGGTTANAYPGYNAANYLGRYGMVRNNWYDVEITAFKKLGSPTYPEITLENSGTPDDDLKDNIAVKIHILSWAKRKQSWEF